MPASPPITLAIGRFEDLIALGLGALLADAPSVSVVARDIAPQRLDVLLRAHRPDVLLLDVASLRDLAQVRELRSAHPGTHLVLLAEGLSSAEFAQLLAFGASACLSKHTQARDLLHAVHLASRGLQLMPLSAHDAGAHPSAALLTPREGDVLLLLRGGDSNAQIAAALSIGVETVRSHARNIYRKLGVSSRRTLRALPSAPAPGSPPAASHPGRRRADRGGTRRRLHD